MGDSVLTVNLVLDTKPITVPINSSTTCEDVCIHICKQLNIGTLTRHLFALRVFGKHVFIPSASTLSETFGDKPILLDFRIRFKVPNVTRLKKLDINAYNYFFHQARNDVLENKIPGIIYEKYRRELIGLGITDMYRVMLEKDIPRETVQNEYKKYIPKEVLKRHSFFIKGPIQDTLRKLQRSVHEASFVKAEYLRQLDIIAPEYLSESFKAVVDQDGSICNIIVNVSPYHSTEPGVRYCMESKKDQWVLICSIEELGFISIRNDGTIEISRKNGIPFYLKFSNVSVMYSFISLLDGYYRLTCKWTFNICKEVYTPSLQKLQSMKCHGPVGGEFSYAKLESKRGNRPGCFVIRESESKYNNYYIDVCMKEGLKPKTFKLERITGDEFIFNDDVTRYKTIKQLMMAYHDPNGPIYLQECLPPSEYDVSPLLLCRNENLVGDSLTDSSALNMLIPNAPLCIDCRNLQVYKGNLTDMNVCKVSHLGLEYTGHIAKSESKVRCQSWTSEVPHKIPDDLLDARFADGSKKRAKNYCRNPTKDAMGPWCYTMNYDLQFETCGIPLCRFSQCKVTGPGMEYAGEHHKGVSGRNCLKWNKDRKKVKVDGEFTHIPKFHQNLFPEDSLGEAKKFCRNPSGDIGGPWCFVENEDTDKIEKEYCDVPFCDDPECLVFTKNSQTHMHYTDFNQSLENLTFGIKLWDSDTFSEANARLVLSVMALPLTGKEIEDGGVGIEIVIGNNVSALRYGNNDKPEYEPTFGILKSTEFTKFSLSWHAGFITLSLEGQLKPIFLAEYKTNKNLLGLKKNEFFYYSPQGNNLLWYFPFCKDDSECDVHTTTGEEFQQFWPLREKDLTYDLYVHVRAHHSARILFLASPTSDYPRVKLILSGKNSNTMITAVEYKGASDVILKEMQVSSVLDYWEWREFSIGFFGNNMNLYVKKPLGLQVMAELTDDIFRKMRWFSVSSENTVAHWSFFCTPPKFSNPPPAFLPECALNAEEPNYKGTQDITSEGLPCLPWSAHKLIGEEVTFSNESVLRAWNYCRDQSGANKGTYCYAISRTPDKKVEKKYCRLRKCKSEQCRMAGTGNDYIGSLSTTRSNRTCAPWVFDSFATRAPNRKIWNDTLFPDMAAVKAKNHCRNPSRNISGSWCYTTDPDVPEDSCNVRDCDRPEECIVIVASVLVDRRIFILPQWKEAGLKGGLRFAIKEWNPDLLDGISILISSKDGSDNILLQIAAEYNEKVLLFHNNKLIQEKTLPHLIAAGKWIDFWLQIRRGEIILGIEGVPTSLFEWKSNDKDKEFEPMYLNYASIYAKPMGMFFKCDECHTENISTYNFDRYYPVGIWLEERPIFKKFSLRLRGVGVAVVKFVSLPESLDFFLLTLDTRNGTIFYSRVRKNALMFHLKTVEIYTVMTTNSWTKYDIHLEEFNFTVKKENVTILTFKSPKPMIMYWFSVAAQVGWVTWSANCEPLDLDGPPRDGGWSAWSPWTCTVSCGGGTGYRTRTCSNPHPNIFGKLCQGSPSSSGKCNDFSCGDVSPETLEKIREYLQKEDYSYVIKEGSSQVLQNNNELLKIIAEESPKAYYEWTLNGVFIKPEPSRVVFTGQNIEIKNAKFSDTGLYVCMLFRINKKRVVLRVISLAVESEKYNFDTRATRSLTLACNAVILGYIYSDLSMKLLLNDKVYMDHGTTTLAAVNTHFFDSLNTSHSGDWKCVVEQKDLKLLWVTSLVRINVRKLQMCTPT
ncbi:hypothetical protein JTB14_022498 [Gonioctena quinquepunctata]|nr:hypothetical protein JTB14_022498 [Gonioctena quinquepunctata]